ncbi:MAG: glycosyltransferase family 2 protein [Candidatus Hodarchaeota archaeon]
MDSPIVSVIIPTYNSEKTLDKCLQSIKNQTYKSIETIIIDKFSCDETQHIAKSYDNFLIIVDLGRSAARNKGILESRGKYILSIDSDMELSPTVIEDCLRLIIENDNIGGIRIPERSVGTSFWVKVRDFERSFYAKTDIESARFFIKDLVFEVNGYDEDVTFSEDSTLPQKIEKLGYNVKARIISNILHHENEFSIFKWFKKKYHYGKTCWIYRNNYREYSKKQMNLLYRFGLFLKERRFYSKPILATGVLTLKLLESLSVGLGYIIGRIRNWRKLVKDPIHDF